MPKFTIWVRNGYPFRVQDRMAIDQMLQQIYGGRINYLKDWPADWVAVEGVTLTTAKKMADTVRALNLYNALRDKEFGFHGSLDAPSLHVEVMLCSDSDPRPEWAKEKKK